MKPSLIAWVIAASLPICAHSTPATQEFEVDSVKPAKADLLDSTSRLPSLNVGPGHTLRLENITLKDPMMLAYGVGARQISGPARLFTRFDIVAKISADSTAAQVPLMLQNLLTRRFKLISHREKKEIPVFALEVKAPEPKLHAPEAGASTDSGCTRALSDDAAGTFSAVCHRVTSGDLVQAIQTFAPNYFDRPVVDATGLTGVYDFTLEWIAFSDSMSGGTGPTMFTAIEKLGLKLTAQKKPMEILVIDAGEKEPTQD